MVAEPGLSFFRRDHRKKSIGTMEMSLEQFQTFLQRVVETINGTVNPRLNTPGSVGKKSFTKTSKKDLERLDTKNFTDWMFKLEIAARAVHPGYFELLRCWEMSIDKIKIDDENADGKAASAELYYVLSSNTSGEAFDLVKTVEDLNGAESWRPLTARFNPKTIGEHMLLARRCVKPPKVNQAKDLPGAIDRWDEDVRRIQNVYKKPLGEGLERAKLVEMLPSTLIEGVMARLKQDDTYDSVKVDYLSIFVVLSRWIARNSTITMIPRHRRTVLDGTELVNKGEAKGKSKGKGFQGQCHNCGQFGHRAAECPAKGECWMCGESTHRAADCPKGKEKGKNNTGKATSREKEKERIMASTIGTARAKVGWIMEQHQAGQEPDLRHGAQ